MCSHNDFVFKGGVFVGAFEDMYRSVEDPWNQEPEAFSEVNRKCLNAVSAPEPRGVLDFGSGI